MSGPMLVATREAVSELARRLRSDDRQPVVVVTIDHGAEVPYVDPDHVAEQLEGSAEVYVVTAEASFWLTDALGNKTHSVHSGWVRAYPSGSAWMDDSRLAPAFAATRRNSGRFVTRIVNEVLHMLFRAGAGAIFEARTDDEITDAVVDSGAGAIAIVRVGRERLQARLKTVEVWPGIPFERLLKKGLPLRGVYRRMGLLGEFVPQPVDDDPRRRLIEFVAENETCLAYVTNVTESTTEVLVHPNVEFVLSGGHASVGDVVAVDILEIAGELVVEFSDEETTASLSVLPGGPPWLVPLAPATPRGVEIESEMETEGDGANEEGGVDELWGQEVERLNDLVDQERARVRELERELRRMSRLSVPVVFTDAEAQLRLEMYLSYLTNVPEVERGAFPYGDERFRLGESFLSSLSTMVAGGGIDREKIVRVCAEVVCGTVWRIPSRQAKPWTRPGSSSPEQRADGAQAYRVRLQSNTASARRLKFWRLADGRVELALVLLHDDEI
jgi:hypothetical protein